MKVLVTGATGFIGKHLVNALSKKHSVRAFVRESSRASDIKFLKKCGAEIFCGNFDDKKSLEKSMKNVGAVFHLAGGGYVAATFKKGYDELKRTNMDLTENILEAAAKAGVKKFVHFSSISAMGIITEKEIDEETKCEPATPHEVCKFGTEKIARGYKTKMTVTIMRPGIVYGPYGTNSEIIQLASLVKKHLFIIPGNGNNVMPWVYVKDVVNATVLAFEKNKKSMEKFIIVSSPEPTFNELISEIAKCLGVGVFIVHIPSSLFRLAGAMFEKMGNIFGFAPLINSTRARSMTSNRIYNIQKIKNLGYRQKLSLHESMEETIKWYQENGIA